MQHIGKGKLYLHQSIAVFSISILETPKLPQNTLQFWDMVEFYHSYANLDDARSKYEYFQQEIENWSEYFYWKIPQSKLIRKIAMHPEMMSINGMPLLEHIE